MPFLGYVCETFSFFSFFFRVMKCYFHPPESSQRHQQSTASNYSSEFRGVRRVRSTSKQWHSGKGRKKNRLGIHKVCFARLALPEKEKKKKGCGAFTILRQFSIKCCGSAGVSEEKYECASATESVSSMKIKSPKRTQTPDA